jgi:electron transfer flavoprotein alpha subunit
LNDSLTAVLVGYELANLARDVARFADQVYCLDNSLFKLFQPEAYTAALENLCKKISPDIILVGHTLDNADLAPRLSYRLGNRLVMDCIKLDIDTQNSHLLCSKPVYGGNVIATFSIGGRPQMATLRPKVMEPAQPNSVAGKVTNIKLALDRALVRTELVETVSLDSVSLDKAEAIVSGGRGIGSVEGIEDLKKLAESLRKYFNMVEIGASRPVTDAGWLPPSRQVGFDRRTGKSRTVCCSGYLRSISAHIWYNRS